MPSSDEVAEGSNTRMLRELPQSIHRNQIRRFQGDINAGIVNLRRLSTYSSTYTFSVIKEAEGLPGATASPLQPFFGHDRRTILFIDR